MPEHVQFNIHGHLHEGNHREADLGPKHRLVSLEQLGYKPVRVEHVWRKQRKGRLMAEPEAAPKKKRYNHAYTIAFSLVSDTEDGSDVTSEMLTAAIEQRMAALDKSGDIEWHEAVGPPYDTFEEEDA